MPHLLHNIFACACDPVHGQAWARTLRQLGKLDAWISRPWLCTGWLHRGRPWMCCRRQFLRRVHQVDHWFIPRPDQEVHTHTLFHWIYWMLVACHWGANNHRWIQWIDTNYAHVANPEDAVDRVVRILHNAIRRWLGSSGPCLGCPITSRWLLYSCMGSWVPGVQPTSLQEWAPWISEVWRSIQQKTRENQAESSLWISMNGECLVLVLSHVLRRNKPGHLRLPKEDSQAKGPTTQPLDFWSKNRIKNLKDFRRFDQDMNFYM